MIASRFEVFLVRLDPTKGHEIRKTRLVKRVDKIDAATRAHVLALLAELFAPLERENTLCLEDVRR